MREEWQERIGLGNTPYVRQRRVLVLAHAAPRRP